MSAPHAALPRRALLIECCPYHEELFPAWRNMVADLGYRLDIAAIDGPPQRQVLAAMDPSGMEVYDVGRLHEVPLHQYAFVLLASVVHAGYGLNTPLLRERFGFVPEAPLPDLELLAELGLPSLAIVHEPLAWIEHRPIACFELTRLGEERDEHCFLRFFDDGRWSADCLLDADADNPRQWIQRDGELQPLGDGGRGLRLSGIGLPRDLEPVSDDTYATQDRRTRLVRRNYRTPDLAAHLAGGRHAAATLSPGGQGYLRPLAPDVEWLLPFELVRGGPVQDSQTAIDATEFVYAAGIDYRRKALVELVDAVAATGQEIVMVGGTRDPEFDADPHVRKLRHQIAERGLEGHFHFTGHLEHGAFLDRVRRARFLLPLVDDLRDAGAYLTRLPAAVLLSLGFGVPMILDENLARRLGLEMMITYAEGDLVGALEEARALDDSAYRDLRAAVVERAGEQRRCNRSTLAAILDRILE